MEEGFSIPFEGDLGPLMQVMSELRATMQELANTIKAAFAPIVQQAQASAQAVQQAGASAKRSSNAFVEMGRSVAGAVSTAGKIALFGVALLKLAPVAIRAGKEIAASLRRPLSESASEAESLGSVMQEAFSETAPILRRIAVAAIAVTAAQAGIRLAVGGVRAGFSALGRIGRGIFRGLAAAGRAAANSIRGAFSRLGGMLGKMIPGGGLAGLLGLAGAGGLGFMLVSQAKGAIEAAMSYEVLQTRIEQYAGSAEKAKGLLDDLRGFEVKTMFDLPDLGGALSQLMGSGLSGEAALGIVKELGAVSQSGQQLRELADALSKAFSKQKSQTEELNKFLERGIGLMPQLAAVTGKTGNELTKAIKAGLRFDDVRESIARMSREGGTHFGLLERMGATMTGRISTLSGAWNEFRRAFMQPVLDAVKPIVMDLTRRIEDLIPKAEKFGKTLGNAILAAFAMIQKGEAMMVLGAGIRLAFAAGIDVLMRGMRSAVAFLATALPPIIQAGFAKIRDPLFWKGIGELLTSVGVKISKSIQLSIADIEGSLGKFRAARQRRDLTKNQDWQAETHTTVGKHFISEAGGGVDFAKVSSEAIKAGIIAAAQAGGRPMSEGLQKAVADWKEAAERFRGTVEQLRKESAIPEVSPGASGSGEQSPLGDSIGTAVRQAISVTTSLGRIGGGGAGFMITPMVSEQKRTNALLARIESKIGGGAVARFT